MLMLIVVMKVMLIDMVTVRLLVMLDIMISITSEASSVSINSEGGRRTGGES